MSATDEFEQAARQEEQRDPSDHDLRTVTALARRQHELEDEVEELNNKLKAKKQELRQVQEVDLPEAMQEAGLSKASLDDGRVITVEEGVNAHISKDRQEQAHQWLIDNGYGDLIKNIGQVNFGRDEETRQKFVAALEQIGLDDVAEFVSKVEPQTLKAWARERVRSGEVPPEDLFGIFQYRRAKVETPRR